VPGAADSHLALSLTPASPAAAPAPDSSSRRPLRALDDHAVITRLIGDAAAALVAAIPVTQLLDAGDEQLAGLGLPAAARQSLLAGAELARRFQPAAGPGEPCPGPRHFLPHLALMRAAGVEVLAVLPLDGRLGLLGEPCVVAGGALMHVAVSAREVYAPAVERRAAAVVLAHNHPSGAASPSPEDLAFTRHMARAGALLGVQLVDHLVVTRRGYFSFAEANLLGDAHRMEASPDRLVSR
jgi:DNA repair protein RadC